MRVIKCEPLLAFIMLLAASTSVCQTTRSIADSAGSHFIGEEYSLPANQRICLQILSEDSTYNFVAFDSTLTQPRRVILITEVSFAESIRQKYPHDIVIPISMEKSGFYIARYTSTDSVFSKRFLFVK